MKVLFAVSDDEISEAIVKEYKEKYKEIITYKNVYYFNAIIKEIERDQTYDRIVISEELEPFTNNNYDAIDKFMFEKLDNISDEITRNTSMVLICVDRRAKGEPLLSKLFGIGLYNALMGNDRNIPEVCRLLRTPRSKKEAKIYYGLSNDEIEYQKQTENSVTETEIQNILAHYKRLGKNEEKYIDSFNNIAAQYNDTQLRLIIKYLPLNVKAVLETQSEKYQSIMTFSESAYQEQKKKTEEKKRNTLKIGFIESNEGKSKLSSPVIVPSAMKKDGVKKLGKQKTEKIKRAEEIEDRTPESGKTRKLDTEREKQKLIENRKKEKSNAKKQTLNKSQIIDNEKTKKKASGSKTEDKVQKSKTTKRKVIDEIEPVEVKPVEIPPIAEKKELEQVNEEPPKRKRGRPRKPVDPEAEVKPKRGRGRPRKNPIVEEEKAEEIHEEDDDILQIVKEDDELINALKKPKETERAEEDEKLLDFDYDEEEKEDDLLDFDDEDEEEEEDDSLDFDDEDEEEEEDDLLDFDDEDEEEEEDDLLDFDDEDEEEEEDDSLDFDDEDEEEEEDDLLDFDDEEEEEEEDDLLDFDDEDEEEEEDDLLDFDDEDEEEDEDDLLDFDDEDEEEEEDDLLDFDGEDEEEEEDDLLDFDDEEEEEEDDLLDFDDEDDEEEEDDLLDFDDDEEDDEDNEDNKLPKYEDENDSLVFNKGQESIINRANNRSMDNQYNKNNNEINIETADFSNILTSDKKIVSFIGTSKNGTSFLVNNLALIFSEMGVKTAILDLTKNKNSYYIFTKNEEDLRKLAYSSFDNLKRGITQGINVNRNLSVYTALPGENTNMEDINSIIPTLIRNYSLVLLDCDFETPINYFAAAQEIYVVQSMDILTIQPLTYFLKELKNAGIDLDKKARIVINKEQKIKNLSKNAIIGGISSYNDPAMSYMTKLFDKDKIINYSIPLDIEAGSKYLETLVTCELSLAGYPKSFIENLKRIAGVIKPIKKGGYQKNSSNGYGTNKFSNNMNSTLDEMKRKY